LGTGEENPGTQTIERRVAKIHHKNTKSLAAFEKVLWILWLTPTMDRLFSEAPQKRRAFFDHLTNGLFPQHRGHWTQYKILLKERSRLLSFPAADASWLKTVEEKLARLGAQITKTRREFLALLTTVLPQMPVSFPIPTLTLRETYAAEDEEDLEASLRATLEEHRMQDTQTGNTAAGPHRTEWEVRFSAKGLLASSCSTGEQKALLITLIIAAAHLYKARRSGVPLLLFDDCAAHLDAGRQEALWTALLHLRIQTWITSVTPPHFSATETTLQHFSLENGLCTPSQI
jgi:DNA replication and repair protein RecF